MNLGVVGATTRDVLEQQVAGIIEFQPDLLHLPCGANDITRRRIDFALIERNLRELYELAARTGAQLVTFTLGRAYILPHLPDWTARVREMNELVRAVAASHQAIVVDMWAHPVNDRADLLSADRIHFAATGQAVMATEVTKALVSRHAQRAQPHDGQASTRTARHARPSHRRGDKRPR